MNKGWLLPLFVAMTAQGADVSFYIGTYTRTHKSEGIYLAHLDTETGKLSPATLAAPAQDPGYLAITGDGKFVYAAMEHGGSAVGAYRVEDGKLIPLNQQPSGGSGVCYVSLDAGARHVFAANYNDGTLAALAINPDGSLGERTALETFTGSGPNQARQTKPHAHSVYRDDSGHFVYSCDLGSDNVWTFRYDPEQGTLAPTDPPTAKVPPGSGPRHLAWHPNGRFAYVNGELVSNVIAFARHPGSAELTALQTISSLPPTTPLAGNTSAAIVCHPTGKWLYVSNRGHDSLTVFAIGEDGRLTWVDNTPSEVKFPRGFALDPSGKWLVAAGQNDDRITVFKIDQTTGKLTPTGQFDEIGTPVCILFRP